MEKSGLNTTTKERRMPVIYITEQNLRDLYAKQAFESFTLWWGERLNPGTQQFLPDRTMSIVDRTSSNTY